MHEKFKEVSEKIEVKKAGQKVAGLGKVAWRKTLKESCVSATVQQEQYFNRGSALHESLLSQWMG